jgi:two-component system, NtrC family, response regulator HydG
MKLKLLKQEAEYKAIQAALKLHNNNRSKTAKYLGIDRKTLYNKLWKYEAELQKEQAA